MKNPRKILVVDDDADWREFLRISLEDLGYETVEASTGVQALQVLERGECSLVLLDLHMPGMSGEDVLANLPTQPPNVVLLTSASAQEVVEALSKGPHYYLPKGASREQLSLMLESLQPAA